MAKSDDAQPDDWRDELVAKMDREFIELLDAQAKAAAIGPAATIYRTRVYDEPTPWESFYKRRIK